MSKINNLTPHPVVLVAETGNIEFPVSGQVARCAQTTERIGDLDGIPLSRSQFGEVVDLPKETDGVYYIVSRLVRSALPERKDLLVPNEMVRDEKGVIIGCRSFAVD